MTRLGWSTSAAALVAVAVGVGLHWPAVLGVGVALLVVCLGSLLHLVRPTDLRIERRVSPPRVVKGELAIAHLRLRNLGRRTFPATVATQEVAGHTVDVVLPRLPARERDVRTAVLPTDRRGRHEVGPLVVRRSDPFQLVGAERRYAEPTELLVLPKVLPFRPLRSTLTRSLEGLTDDRTPTGTMTFHQMRAYVPGDDVRRIHWPSTAKLAHTGDLIVRQDVDDAQPYVVVLVDLRLARYRPAPLEAPPGLVPDLELALDAAASVLTAVASGAAPFQLRTTGGQVVGDVGNRSTTAALEALALAEPTPDGSLSAELSALRRTRGGAALVVVSGTLTATELGSVAALRHRFGRVVLVSVGERDRSLGHPGVTTVRGATEQELVDAWAVGTRS